MKKKIIIFSILLSVTLCYGFYWTVFDMNRLPKGKLVSKEDSPDKRYTIKAYVSDVGTTTDSAVLGELDYNDSKNKPKNIYWNYHEKTASIQWVNGSTVIINGHKLNVLHDTFDFRRSKEAKK